MTTDSSLGPNKTRSPGFALIGQGRLKEALTCFESEFSSRPSSPERDQFLSAVRVDSCGDAVKLLHLSAALLECDDHDGSGVILRTLDPLVQPDEKLVLLKTHRDLPGYCGQAGYPVFVADGYDISPIGGAGSHLEPTEATHVCGLPRGIVVGESFAPASADGNVFWGRAIFNPNRAQQIDAYKSVPPLAIGTRNKGLARVTEVVDYGPAVLLGDSTNFGHWLLSYAARLGQIQNILHVQKLPVIVGVNARSFVMETLDLLGINEDRIVKIGPRQMARFDMLWIPQMTFCGKEDKHFVYASAKALRWIRNMLGVHDRRTGSRRLLISRRDSQHRRIVNEDAILELLAPLGFELIEPSRMSLKKQIEIVSQAEVILGGIGAGMALSYLAPTETRIIEICYPEVSMRMQSPMCRMLGQKFVEITSTPIADRKGVMYRDQFVEPATVKAAVVANLA